MRLISIDQINGTETLAQAIYDIEGRMLLNAGVSLRPSIVQKIHEKGISSVYVDDEISEGVEIEGLLCEQTKAQAKMIVKAEMQRLSRNKEIHFSNVSKMVDSILDEILSRRMDVINVKDIRIQDEKIFAHCVNVCVMAIALANKLSLPISKVKSIALGAIMHDIGKAFISPAILIKNGNLTDAELAELRMHPVLGYNILKDNDEAPATTKIAVLMHHEHFNGSGYPMGLSGDKIHYSARIITLCNAYDNVINDTSSKNVLQTTDAVEYIIGASNHIFDKSIVDEFIKIIPIYTEGSIVLLSNGHVAIVVKNNPVNLTRPVVRVFYNPKAKVKLSKTHIIDLRTELSVKILREIKVNVSEMMG